MWIKLRGNSTWYNGIFNRIYIIALRDYFTLFVFELCIWTFTYNITIIKIEM